MAGFLWRQVLRGSAKKLLKTECAAIFVSRTKVGVFETDKKAGYRKDDPQESITNLIKEGLKQIKGEFSMLSDEAKEKIYADPFLGLQHGDYEYAWKLNSREAIDQWVVTSDRDNLEGNSKASLALTRNNTAMFHGYLSQEVPKDGIIKSTGYANIKGPNNYVSGSMEDTCHFEKSFKRQVPYDWSLFNCLVMRVRGDGRSYMLNILMEHTFDVNWNDQYNYSLFTRGGPYWQIAKIPFSKFFLSSKGRIQDKQEPILLQRVSSMGITIGDGNEGPFSLEIDYIALMYDENHYEEFAYEMYTASPAQVGT